MMQLLSTEILDWVDPKDFSLHNYSNNGLIGFFLKVDLDYPDGLHDLHSDYPLAGEKQKSRKKCCPIINYKSQNIKRETTYF